jgi:hypothetical protein
MTYIVSIDVSRVISLRSAMHVTGIILSSAV